MPNRTEFIAVSRSVAPVHAPVALCPWLILLLIGSGCGGTRMLVATQAAAIDSLQALSDSLARDLDVYRDSIAFYDFIESGEFDRDMRFKETQVNRLTYELAMCLDGGETIATELVDELFEPASAILTDGGRERLALLADNLADKTARGTVRVEGYSDSTRPSGKLKERYPSNWELSAARASAVVRYFVNTHELDPERFVVASFAENRAFATNSSRRGRRLNRRIRFSYLGAQN